ncbi:hypothetical protein [Kineosporia sp. NBRC 101677]|uniref:hypothetical protein n=1 Tax=Kineosporia sp. NBRC 101677 TaxID=3032197 RepID=UPI00255261DC|nr:hypothetical protein [Kineosporia sp. NBRC 101677]
MSPVTGSLLAGRLRAARARSAAVVLGLAVAVLIPVLIAVATRITADETLGRALAELPAGQRSAIVSFNGILDRSELDAMDAVARDQLPALTHGPIRRQLIYRALADGTGTDFALAATDDLPAAVRLVEGRLPRGCAPQHCEVVAVLATSGARPEVADLGLKIVGTVERSDPLLLSGTFEVGDETTMLLADGVPEAGALSSFEVIGRTQGWVGELDRGVISSQGAEGWSRTADAVADAVVRHRPGTALTIPRNEVRGELGRASASAQRFGLLAGGCGLLLLGAAVIGGAALRPDVLRFAEALRRRGLGPVRIRLVLMAEALILVLAAAGLGLALGAGAAMALLDRAGLPVTAGTLDALGAAAPGVAVLLGLGFVLLSMVLRPVKDPGESWQAVGWAALAGLTALVLIISRGSAEVASRRGDPLLVALPVLLLLTAALLAARTWPWVLHAGGRALPRRAVATRLALAGLAGRPLIAASCLALLVAAIGATGFAASYRSTLDRGALDQAAFSVPTDARIRPGVGLRPVLSVAAQHDYAATAPGATATAVVRQAGSLRVGLDQSEPVQLIGLDPAALSRIRRWPTVVGDISPGQVAKAIAAPRTAAGQALPAGQGLRIEVRDWPVLVATAWVRADDGREVSVPLSERAGVLQGALPPGRGWSLASLSLSQTERESTSRQHRLGESDTTAEIPFGEVDLGPVSVDGSPVAHPWQGWEGDGLKVGSSGEEATFAYELAQSTVSIWSTPPPAGAPGATAPIKVAADPLTAAQSSSLTLIVSGQPVTAQVVAVLPRMPTVSGRFVLADSGALSPVFSRLAPGGGQAGEIWLSLDGSADPPANALQSGQFAGLDVQWASDVARDLRTDPVAEGAQRVLFLAALATLLVALAAVVLLVISERAEDADRFRAWEASGVRPGVLRRALWGRAVLILGVSAPAGVAAGLGLTALTARLVQLTAGAAVPEPPLVPVIGAGLAVPLVLGAFAVALAGSGVVALTSFREAQPR